MKVYHGSYLKVQTIDLSFGRPNKDFGLGFYVTKIKKLAQEWADRKGADNQTKGVVSEFIFDEYIWEDDEMQATDFFFSSQTFSELSDKSTSLYLKPWQEIYAMLKKETKARQ